MTVQHMNDAIKKALTQILENGGASLVCEMSLPDGTRFGDAVSAGPDAVCRQDHGRDRRIVGMA